MQVTNFPDEEVSMRGENNFFIAIIYATRIASNTIITTTHRSTIAWNISIFYCVGWFWVLTYCSLNCFNMKWFTFIRVFCTLSETFLDLAFALIVAIGSGVELSFDTCFFPYLMWATFLLIIYVYQDLWHILRKLLQILILL